MTRAKTLKRVIRARAAKTGERYTTARRQILKDFEVSKAATAPVATPAPQPQALPTKGSLSDAKSIEKTGHDLGHWFALLDGFGGLDKGHAASAAWLYRQHGVPRWHCQSIVVAYERARGTRVVHQRCDGRFEVSVSKVIAASTPALVTAFTDATRRKEWSLEADARLVEVLEASLKAPALKGFITRPDGRSRFRFKWDDTTVQLNLYPKGPAKSSIVVQQTGLRSAADVERHRDVWKATFAALAAAVATTP